MFINRDKKMNRLLKAKIRCKKYRKKILEISQSVPALHIGGSFSSVEIVDCIYNRLKKNTDKFILSKGHAGILQYVILNDLGIIKNKDLKNYQKKKWFSWCASRLWFTRDNGFNRITWTWISNGCGYGLGI